MKKARPQKNTNESADLECTADDRDEPDLPEILERELEADSEEQQDDANLCEARDLVLTLDDGEPIGADYRAGQDEGDQGGHPIRLKTIPTMSATAKTIRILVIDPESTGTFSFTV